MSQPIPQPSWKEEVNRRLEAHKNRRGISVVDQNSLSDEPSAVSNRAAQAAARVAARFSKAPSYSEMQASEARAALRAAEAATRVALEAQAAAQVALANLQTAEEERSAEAYEFQYHDGRQESTPTWDPEPVAAADSPEAQASWKIRWEPDLPVRPSESASAPARHRVDPREDPASWTAGATGFERDHAEAIVEAAQPIHANLIHFPREIVATRRMRPRLGAQSNDVSPQLSIFEVDPSSVSTDPMVSVAEASSLEPSWAGPEWSSIELDAHPRHELAAHPEPARVPASSVHLAPLELRLMAAAVDIALTLILVCAAAFSMSGHLEHAPALKFAEMSAIAGFILMSLAYQAFFLLTAGTTPGMKYAGIALCTFDDEYPTRMQLRDRLVALLISLLPVGLGVAWAIFDEDHLSWHDRLSRTYHRRC